MIVFDTISEKITANFTLTYTVNRNPLNPEAASP
jgi:hypothetical protein